jgi:hypothetical protein
LKAHYALANTNNRRIFSSLLLARKVVRERTSRKSKMSYNADEQQQQHDEEETEDDDQEEEDNPRKRKRGPYKSNQILSDLYEHFTTLNEKRTSSVGKQSCHYMCICNYCQHHYEQALLVYNNRRIIKTSSSSSVPLTPAPEPPKKVTRCTRDCEGHLRKCLAYRNYCQENNILPYGHQVHDEKKQPSEAATVTSAVASTKKSSASAPKVASVSLKAAPTKATGTLKTLASAAGAAIPALLHVKKEAKVSGSKHHQSMKTTIVPRIPKNLPTMDPRLELLLLEFLVDNDLPLQTVSRPSFARLMEVVAARCSSAAGFQVSLDQLVPSCTKLRDVTLVTTGTSSLAAIQAKLDIEFNRGHAAAMIVKTRMVPIITAASSTTIPAPVELSIPPSQGEGMRSVHVIDSVLLQAGKTTLTLDIYKDPSVMSSLFKQQDGMAIARVWENMLLNHDHHHHGISTSGTNTATITAAVAASPTPATTGETPAATAAANDDEEYFRYFLSEDIGNCSRARNILALRHPSMLWLRCWVHQLQAMVQKLLHTAVLKQQTLQFHKVCTRAIKAAHAMQASSTTTAASISKVKSNNATAAVSSLALQLQAIVDDMYEASTWTGVSTVNASTGWSGMQACFASQLCIRDACVSLASKLGKKEDIDNTVESTSPPALTRASFPMALRVWKDPEYWEELQLAESLIRPFCEASRLLQEPQANTLAHVMFMLLSLYSKLQSYYAFLGEDAAWRQMAEVLIADIEERWEKEDNALFFLAFALHPSFRNVAVDIVKKSGERDGSWNATRNPLSVSRLVSAAKFYYEKHKLHQASSISSSSSRVKAAADCTKRELDLLGKRIHQWLIGREFDALSPYIPQQEDAVAWWEENKFEYPEISRLAVFLLDAPIRASADCSTLFQQQSPDTFPPPPPTSPIDREEQHRLHYDHQQQFLLKKKHPSMFYMRQIIRDEMKGRYVSADAASRDGHKGIPTAVAAANPSRQRAIIIDATQFKLSEEHKEKADDESLLQKILPPPSPPSPPQQHGASGDVASSNVGKEHNNDTSKEHINIHARTAAIDDGDDEDERETEIEYWLRILESVLPKHDDSNDDHENFAAPNKKDAKKKRRSIDEEDDLMESSDNEEDLPETNSKPLPPLPKHDDNDKSYPHEGPRYFATKNYVRKDKYALDKLLQGGDVALPSILAFV